ncbi:hypothetical protein CQW49_02565 [Methylosinus trichosporium OB3b]|uniref:Uncharacterized protein n=2 Tax=Methylocystaceae TaxID=31993 RepID=A0A2D2CW19_METT3|nr:hypothetical protein CQW49_02565 [Methylosinus trichosporium OB3b]
MALLRHQSAEAAYLAALAVTDADDVVIPLMNRMWDALKIVMSTPCHSDAEFAEKARYVFAQMERWYGLVAGQDNEHDGYIVAMLRQRLGDIVMNASKGA